MLNDAVHWAQVTQQTIDVESTPKDTPVLFTSEGFSPLFSMVVPPAMTGEKMVRKESFWSDKLNQTVINQNLSIQDNGLLDGGMTSGSRDGEGVPRRQQMLVENGIMTGMLWSTRDAAQQVAEGRVEAAQSTGSATSGGHQSPPSTGCTELFLTSKAGGNRGTNSSQCWTRVTSSTASWALTQRTQAAVIFPSPAVPF